MPDDAPEPPARSFEIQISIPEVGEVPDALAKAFTSTSTEAQMLEHALKSAITKDVQVFAGARDQVSFLETLEKATLGQARHIAADSSTRKDHKLVAACVGFYDFVKMQWQISGRREAELNSLLKEVVDRRNRIAHALLAEGPSRPVHQLQHPHQVVLMVILVFVGRITAIRSVRVRNGSNQAPDVPLEDQLAQRHAVGVVVC